MGLAVLDQYPSVDYISFGEGDEVIAAFCKMLLESRHDPLPYGILGKGKRAEDFKAPHRLTADMNMVPLPEYRDFFEEAEKERRGDYGPSCFYMEAENTGEPFRSEETHYGEIVFLEGSRGCWWGEKHACSFCGLNGLQNVYREKDPGHFLEEIRTVTKRYPGCRIQMSDNVLSSRMIRELLPALESDETQYRIFAEVKTNLSESDIRALVRAGIRNVQPGIESLNDHLLQLMRKGNTAINHVAFLKYCRAAGLLPSWNLLYGVPGEVQEDYEEMAKLLPALTHLRPPTSFTPISFQRYSRYWMEPEAYGLVLEPDPIYRYCLADQKDLIRQTAMLYDVTGGSFQKEKEEHAGCYLKVGEQVKKWKALWSQRPVPELIMTDTSQGISILDTRPCRTRLLTRLKGIACDIYRLAWSPVSYAKLQDALGERVTDRELQAILQEMTDSKLMVSISERYLALAIP
ncbi:MAG: RiPP maturation radical SAM C-methyltransferase [Parasporobacterium sp.]|nr:RiPP maturation radical SAM C-methyltransferase [Parasporobacterium sp.]